MKIPDRLTGYKDNQQNQKRVDGAYICFITGNNLILQPICERLSTGDVVPCFYRMISKENIETILNRYPEGEGMFVVEIAQNKDNRISIYVDRPEGIDVAECSEITRFVRNELEETTDENFELTVSSPGLDRPLRVKEQYLKNIGRDVKITTTDGKDHKGKLIDFREDNVILKPTVKKKKEKKKASTPEEATELILPLADIKQTKIVITF